MTLIRPKDLGKVLGCCRDTARKIAKSPDFPAPRKVYGDIYGWLSEEVDQWLRSRPKGDV